MSAALGADACLTYVVNLEAMADGGGFMSGTSAGGTQVFSSARWMWRPAPLASAAQGEISATVEFNLPPGVDVAVPWPVASPVEPRSHPHIYRVDRSVFSMRSYTILGTPKRLRFEVAGAQVEVVMPDLPHAASDAGIEAWLRAAGEAVATLYGRFPVDALQILVLPVGSWRDDPVVFGMTARGGASSLVLLVDAGAQDHELIGEWVAVHEMLHLGMPYVQRQDAWFSEGFATYYQQVVRARAGLLDASERGTAAPNQTQAALEILAAGFANAHAASTALDDASRKMSEQGGYRRVYWGGAAIWMRLDIALLRATGGEQGADDIARAIHACCAGKGGSWSAEQLIRGAAANADLWTEDGGEILRQQVKNGLAALGVPGPREAFEGLAVAANGENVTLLAEPRADAARRAAIFNPR